MRTFSILFLLVALVATPSARGQDIPLFEAAEIMAANTTMRTNFCPLHADVESGRILMRNALKGMGIRPVLMRYQIDSETGALPEVHPDMGIKLLDELARRAQFEWRDSYAVIDSPVNNETWDDVMHWSIDTFDLMGEWFLRSTARMANGIIFPEGWYDGSLIMIMKQDKVEDVFQLNAFLAPFTTGVWLLIAVMAFVSGLVFYGIDYIECFGDKEIMSSKSINDSLFMAFTVFTGHILYHPKKPANRIVVFSTCFMFLILTASYTANLASHLVVKNSKGIIVTDIRDAINHRLRFCVMAGSASDDFLSREFEMAILVRKDYGSNGLDMYLSLDTGECDITIDSMDGWKSKQLDIKANQGCEKEWIGRIVRPLEAGYSIRDSARLCSSLLRDVLSLHLLEMKIDKTFETIWNNHRKQTTTNLCKNDSDDDADDDNAISISLTNFGGIFIIHTVALATGILYALFTRNKSEERRRNKISKGAPGAVAKKIAKSVDNGNMDRDGSRRSSVDISSTEFDFNNSMASNEISVSGVQATFDDKMIYALKKLEAMEKHLAKLTEGKL